MTFLLNLVIIFSTMVTHVFGHPILIVIAFDGFRHDYVNETLTPNLFRVAHNGVTGHMLSSFATKTFPNMQSIATGYHEEVHGIINNKFYDPLFNDTFYPNAPDKWWTEGPMIPIWIANQMSSGADRYSGSVYWAGSHVHYRNRMVRHFLRYEPRNLMDFDSRFDKAIEWLTAEDQRANCVFVYFEEPDQTAHNLGPFSEPTLNKVRALDRAVGHLMKRLEETGLANDSNIIFVSDHGMAEIKLDHVIELNKILDPSWYRMYGKSPDWHIVANPGFEDLVYEKLFNASKTMNFTVYKKEEIPELYHYKNNRRILPIFLLADEGWDIYPTFDKSYLVNGTEVWGNHGFDNSLDSMRPLFVAKGPAFKSNYVHDQVFHNIDLYPLMLTVLQLPLDEFPSNGTLSKVVDILEPRFLENVEGNAANGERGLKQSLYKLAFVFVIILLAEQILYQR